MITLVLLAVAIIAIGGFWPRIKAWISSEETKIEDEVKDKVDGTVNSVFQNTIETGSLSSNNETIPTEPTASIKSKINGHAWETGSGNI